MRRVFSLNSYKEKISVNATGSKQWEDDGHGTIPHVCHSLLLQTVLTFHQNHTQQAHGKAPSP
jgi:hypothetical protein